MAYRNPVKYAVDQTARDLANQALTDPVSGDRIDGTITGVVLQTAPSGNRVVVFEETGVWTDGSPATFGAVAFSDGHNPSALLAAGAASITEPDGTTAYPAEFIMRLPSLYVLYGQSPQLTLAVAQDPTSHAWTRTATFENFDEVNLPAASITLGDVITLANGGVLTSAPIESTAGYQLLTPSPGWGNDTSGSYLPLQVRKDSSGVVHCWGLLRNTSGATISAPSTIATIPAAFQGPKEQPSCAYAQTGLTRVDYVAAPTQALRLLVGSVGNGQYLAINLSWPSNDLPVT